MKRFLRLSCNLLIVLLMIISTVPSAFAASYTVPSGSVDAKLSYLRDVFKDGWYWNHWSASSLGNYKQENITINGHATTISNKPCSKHTSGAVNSSCNHYWGSWGGSQCLGFGRMMFELVWNMDPETEAYSLYYLPDKDDASCLDYIKKGDLVWDGTHARFITNVSGNTFTYVDCNWDTKCLIKWDRTITKNDLHSRMRKNGSGYIYSPVPMKLNDAICDWYTYEVVTAKLNMRSWASTASTKVNGKTYSVRI